MRRTAREILQAARGALALRRARGQGIPRPRGGLTVFRGGMVVAACLLLGGGTAHAIGGSGALRIQAEQAELDNVEGVSVYTGSVELTREGASLTGDRLEVYTDSERRLARVVMTGSPARYVEDPADGRPLRAEAPRMEYHASGPERLRLLEGAVLWQGENEFRGRTIVYEPGRDRVTAEGGGDGDRIDIRLFPGTDQGATPSP